jgi:hypothetical protein
MNDTQQLIVAMYAGFGIVLILAGYLYKRSIEKKDRAMQSKRPVDSLDTNPRGVTTENDRKKLISAER